MTRTRCDICDRNFKNEEALEMHNQVKHASPETPSKKVNKKKIRNWTIFLIVIGIVVVLIVSVFSGVSSGGEYDTFAQCLTDNGAKMYGAYWCPHCLSQKSMFGKSWKHVDYIECSLPNRGGQNGVCNAAGIESYPTWEFADGTRIGGSIPIEQLSQITDCSIEPPEV